MPVIIILAASGLLQLSNLLRNPETKKRALYLCTTAILLFITAHILLPTVCNIAGQLDPIFARLILSACQLTAIVFFFYVLTSIAMKEVVYSSRIEKYSARAVIVFLTIITATVIVVPARANGRLLEWQAQLSNPGDKLEASIPFLHASASGPYYLLLDTTAHPLYNSVLKVNGKNISGPFLPSLSLLGDLHSFKALNAHQVYLECGYIFNCLSTPAQISNLDLRQWFLVPLPQDVIDSAQKKGSIDIELTKAGQGSFNVYGQYVSYKRVRLPDLYRCSWEKAFYGVESSKGFSDPRYDMKLKEQLPQMKPVLDVLLLSCNPPADSITSKSMPTQIEHNNEHSPVVRVFLPPYNQKDFWIVHFSGTVKSANLSRLNLEATVFSKHTSSQAAINYPAQAAEWAQQTETNRVIKNDWVISYCPPWLPHSLASNNTFDFAFPLIPSAMPGQVSSVELNLSSAGAPLNLSNCKVEVYKCPGNPLDCPEDFQLPSRYSLLKKTGSTYKEISY
jgi:hypothetical protein